LTTSPVDVLAVVVGVAAGVVVDVVLLVLVYAWVEPQAARNSKERAQNPMNVYVRKDRKVYVLLKDLDCYLIKI